VRGLSLYWATTSASRVRMSAGNPVVPGGRSTEVTVVGTGGSLGGGSAATCGETCGGCNTATGGAGCGVAGCIAAGGSTPVSGRGIACGWPCGGAGRGASTPGTAAIVGVSIVVFCGNGGGGSSIPRRATWVGGFGVMGGPTAAGAAIDDGTSGGG